MALVTIPGGGLWTSPGQLTSGLNTSQYVMDASGEIAALIIRVPKTGTVTRFEALVSTVTNAFDNGLRFSFQDVSATTGLPDGVVDQSATIASGAQTTGWVSPGDFGSSRSVTRGDVLALVIDNVSFTAGDSIAIGAYTSAIETYFTGFPYGISATSTRASNILPSVALRYDDGTYAFIQHTGQFSTVTAYTIGTGSTPDEAGLAFTLPYPAALGSVRFMAAINAGANFDIVLYDAASSPLLTVSNDGDVVQSASGRVYTVLLSSLQTLTANTLYRIVFKPTTAATSTLYYSTHASAALMDTLAGGQGMYLTTRADAGAWTDYNNGTDGYRRPMFSLGFEQVDDGVSTGGQNRAILPSGVSALG